jgi:hypothetical protein
VDTLCKLFDTLVLPVLSYGCEVWSPSLITGYNFDMCKGKTELLHRSFLRQILGVNKSTPIAIMLHELNRRPVMATWLVAVARCWNRLCKLGNSNNIAKSAVIESIALHRDQQYGWAHEVVHMVHVVAGDMVQPIDEHGRMICIDPVIWQQAVDAYWQRMTWNKGLDMQGRMDRVDGVGSVIRRVPDDERDGYKLYKYLKWFNQYEVVRVVGGMNAPRTPGFTAGLHRRYHIKKVAQFRMGSHWLNSERLRGSVTCRSQRFCACCDEGVPEDELHFLLCPRYTSVREQFEDVLHILFDENRNTDIDACMNNVVNGTGSDYWFRFADLLIQFSFARDQYLQNLGG